MVSATFSKTTCLAKLIPLSRHLYSSLPYSTMYITKSHGHVKPTSHFLKPKMTAALKLLTYSMGYNGKTKKGETELTSVLSN